MSEVHDFKDSKVFIKRQKYTTWSVTIRKWRCPICHEYIEDNTEVCLVFNNNKYFPNVILHKCCLDNNDLENVLECIEREYENMKFYKDIF